MAENINIGNGGKGMSPENFDRALDVSAAFSDADRKFVDEMLSDSTAAQIRAANRRKTLRIRNSLAACAAAFVIVVGLAVIPRGGLKNDSAKTAAPRDAAAERAEEAAPAADNFDGGGKDIEGDEPAMKPEAADDHKKKGNTAATTNAAGRDTEQAKSDDDYRDNADAAAGEEAKPEIEQNDEKTDAPSEQYAELHGETRDLLPGGYIELGNGSKWFAGEKITDEGLCGKLISKEDGFEVYELDGFDPEYITAVKQNGGYRAAITADLAKNTLAELSEGLGFKNHLHCERYMSVTENESVSDEVFRNSVIKLLTDLGGSYRLDPSFSAASEGTGSAGTYVCSIRTGDVTLIDPIYITVTDKAVTVTCYNESAMFEQTIS